MSQSIEGMESERQREYEFSGIFYSVRKTLDKFDNVSAVEGGGCDEISKRESIKHWIAILFSHDTN